MILSRNLHRYLYPAGLILVNLILKIWFLDSRDIAMDEPFTIFHAQSDLSVLFETLKGGNNTPLDFILLHFWIKLFGISAFSVRFLPMMFSIATAYYLYLIGKKFFTFQIGVVASLLFTFSNYHLLFAHEARGYALFTILSSISMLLFLILVKGGTLRIILWLAFTNVLLVYTHFFGFFVIFVQIVSGLGIKELRLRSARNYIISLLVVILFYFPYFFVLIPRFHSTAVHGTWIPKPIPEDLYNMVWKFSNAPVTTVIFLLIMLVGTILFFFGKVNAGIRIHFKIILIWFFVPYFMMFLISFQIPMFLDRYLVFVSIAYYLLIANSIEIIGRKRWTFFLTATVAIGSMILTFKPNVDNKRRMREAVQTINSFKTKESAIVICPSWLDLGFSYYYNQNYFIDYKDLKKNLTNEMIFPVNGIGELDTVKVNSAKNIIFFEEWATLVDKDELISRYLENHFPVIEKVKVYESFTITNFSK